MRSGSPAVDQRLVIYRKSLVGREVLSEKMIRLNVGGRSFATTLTTLQKYPDTFLARSLATDNKIPLLRDETGAYFIDRNGELFAYVLDYYRIDRVVYPTLISREDFNRELDFWGITPEPTPAPAPRRIEDIVRYNNIFVYLLHELNERNTGETQIKQTMRDICRIIGKICKLLQSGKGSVPIAGPIDGFSTFFNFRKMSTTYVPCVTNDKKKYSTAHLGVSWDVDEIFIRKLHGTEHCMFLEFEF